MGARAENNAAVAFTGIGSMTHFTVWDSATGGNLQGSGVLGTPQPLPAQFLANVLRIEVGDGVFSDDSDKASVDARKAKITHIQAHSGAPGADGTNNTLGNRVAVTWGQTIEV